jgi:predicted amidohydrolase
VKSSANDSRHVAFDTPLGKVGLLICWDLAFPEAFRELIMQGAKMIIVPAFWKYTDAGDVGIKRNPRSEGDFLDAAVVSRAFENTCAVVFCNVGGPSDEGFAGRSQVAMPFLGRVELFSNSDEGMKIVELDMDVLDEAEGEYKVRQDLASPGWHYGYRQ